MIAYRTCVLVVASLATCLPASRVFSQPTQTQPDLLLEVRDEPTSKELATQAGILYRESLEEVADYEAKLRDGKITAGNARDVKAIGLTANKITRIKRFGERLADNAEPAGWDLSLRADELQRRNDAVIKAYRALPKTNDLITVAATQARPLSTAKARSLPRIGTFFKQGKVELAEKGLDDIHDELEPLTVWFNLNTYKAVYNPFLPANALVYPKAKELRVEAINHQLEQLRAAETPDFAGVLKQMQAAVESVRTTGSASWNGESVTGPQLVSLWVAAWKDQQTKTLHCRASDWARGIKQGVRPPSELDQLEAAYLDFENQAIALVGTLISADAGRVIPDGVSQLYVQYLAAIARATPHIEHPKWLPTVEAELKKLSEKSPTFAQQVANYRQATGEMLRWRERAAAAAAKSRISASEKLEHVWGRASNDQAMVARKPPARSTLTFLSSGGPSLLRDVAQVAVDQPATVENLAPCGDRTACSRYRNRLFARVAHSALPAGEVAQLKADLLVSDDNPPLTLEAAIAILSAQDGFLQSAGGKITDVELQSLIVHHLKLTNDRAHIALGPLSGDAAIDDRLPIDQVMYVFDIRPTWLQHKYVFVELP